MRVLFAVALSLVTILCDGAEQNRFLVSKGWDLPSAIDEYTQVAWFSSESDGAVWQFSYEDCRPTKLRGFFGGDSDELPYLKAGYSNNLNLKTNTSYVINVILPEGGYVRLDNETKEFAPSNTVQEHIFLNGGEDLQVVSKGDLSKVRFDIAEAPLKEFIPALVTGKVDFVALRLRTTSTNSIDISAVGFYKGEFVKGFGTIPVTTDREVVNGLFAEGSRLVGPGLTVKAQVTARCYRRWLTNEQLKAIYEKGPQEPRSVKPASKKAPSQSLPDGAIIRSSGRKIKSGVNALNQEK